MKTRKDSIAEQHNSIDRDLYEIMEGDGPVDEKAHEKALENGHDGSLRGAVQAWVSSWQVMLRTLSSISSSLMKRRAPNPDCA